MRVSNKNEAIEKTIEILKQQKKNLEEMIDSWRHRMIKIVLDKETQKAIKVFTGRMLNSTDWFGEAFRKG